MAGIFLRSQMMAPGGQGGQEVLDRPTNNYDVAGVPRDQWSSGLCSCTEHFDSCCLAFCCPSCLWSQIVVRAQIPALIDLKNYFRSLRGSSGYFLFIDFYCWSLILIVGFIIGFIFLRTFPYLGTLSILLAIAIFIPFVYLLGHVRTAFRMKYSLPGYFPRGAEAWDCVMDACLSFFCHPCTLAQMARHVFQYHRWQPPLGLYLGDPALLPPLETDYRRPPEADNAGLAWLTDAPLPNAPPSQGRGTSHATSGQRQASLPTFGTPQRMNDRNDVNPTAPVAASAMPVVSPVYNPDGTPVTRNQ